MFGNNKTVQILLLISNNYSLLTNVKKNTLLCLVELFRGLKLEWVYKHESRAVWPRNQFLKNVTFFRILVVAKAIKLSM